MLKQKSRTKRRTSADVPVMSAGEAAALIRDGDVVAFCGAGGGITEASAVIDALAERHRTSGEPRDLTFFHSTGLGDRGEKGMSPLARKGLVRRAVGGHWGQSPRLAEMCDRDEIESYNLPMGIMSQMMRAAAAGQPGILSPIGLGTFLDPREQGGRLNAATTGEIIELTEVDGEEYLFYKTIYPDVAIIRATTADTEGYLTMEDEITFVDNLATAMAAHNNGGVVIAQVQKVVRAGSLHPKQVRVPGYLVDALVVVPDQPQLYGAPVNRFLSGDYTADFSREGVTMPLGERKVIARRALLEVAPGDIGNVGVGVCDGIGVVAREEGVCERFTLTVETGPVGGVSAQGIFFGASVNMKAMLEMPSQFDFYDGGGLDISFLSFAEVDRHGNVNVHKFGGKTMGTGGFTNICQNAKKAVFCGTLTAGGLRTEVADGALRLAREGRFIKFVERVPEITFSGERAARKGQEVVFITERAVFRLTERGLTLCEIAPGIDLEWDVFARMGFRPVVADTLREMDARLFREEPMGVADQELARE